MRVFRIQNEDGYGPYTCLFNFDFVKELKDMYNKHSVNNTSNSFRDLWPTAYADCQEGWLKDHRCGFINEAQLFNWFSEEELKMLKSHGFDLVILDKEVVSIGKNQIVFTP